MIPLEERSFVQTTEDILSGKQSLYTSHVIPMSLLRSPFRLKVIGLSDVDSLRIPGLDYTVKKLKVRSFLFHGMEVINDTDLSTSAVDVCRHPRWGQWLDTSDNLRGKQLTLDRLPRASRIALLVYGEDENGKEVGPLCWVALQLVRCLLLYSPTSSSFPYFCLLLFPLVRLDF